jgi:hypothetical protein
MVPVAGRKMKVRWRVTNVCRILIAAVLKSSSDFRSRPTALYKSLRRARCVASFAMDSSHADITPSLDLDTSPVHGQLASAVLNFKGENI